MWSYKKIFNVYAHADKTTPSKYMAVKSVISTPCWVGLGWENCSRSGTRYVDRPHSRTTGTKEED